LEHNDLFLPNIMRKSFNLILKNINKFLSFLEQKVRYRQKFGTKTGNVKNLSESFINNFKVKNKERMKKRHHTNFFLNLDQKQF